MDWGGEGGAKEFGHPKFSLDTGATLFKQKSLALSFRRPYVNFAHLGPEQVQGAKAKSQNLMFRGSGRKLM